MKKIRIYMKSRNIIEFVCKEFEKITKHGELVELNWDNESSKLKLFHLDLNSVDGIVVEDI
ncbi:MAG TPA: hypothetical protein VFC70_01035 [Oscillospiraceae bacterium]|nr:hypothetical protein [Oscillospiraceae bacterium]